MEIRWRRVTADSGYCSEKNLLYLKKNEIRSYIKLQDHEKQKTRVYKEDIGKYSNMTYAVFEDEHYYICHDGRELRHIRTESKEQDGYTQTVEVYGCADCSGCEHKSKCIYKYNAEKNADRNKVMKINERWEELKEESNMNIQSEEGILNGRCGRSRRRVTLEISRRMKTSDVLTTVRGESI